MPVERPCQKSVAEKSCHFTEVFPFFKNKADFTSLKTIDKEEREKLKNEIIFLTELSRFMNQKAPLLLKVSAMSPQSFYGYRCTWIKDVSIITHLCLKCNLVICQIQIPNEFLYYRNDFEISKLTRLGTFQTGVYILYSSDICVAMG